MQRYSSALLIGTLFGFGLALSGMMNPAKVVGFLDLAGSWDPTLAFVMAGALLVTIPGFWLVRKRQGALLGGGFQIPTRKDIDAKLLGGALLFGVGWGVAGFCPGPAVAALSTGLPQVLLFMAALLSGMILHRLVSRGLSR
ncbi:MAG: YeeE/YedE family protein [Limibacillus sp.]|jgi:uncharacterized membrane protein YedE/YeeE